MKQAIFFLLTSVLACFAIQCNYDAASGDVHLCIDPSCVGTEPTTADLHVAVTLNQTNPKVPIVVYLGDFDDVQNHSVVIVDTLTVTDVVYTLPLSDTKYSATALYLRSGGDTVLVVDDDLVSDDYDSDCDCYTSDNGHLDLKLRFPKPSVRMSPNRGIEVHSARAAR